MVSKQLYIDNFLEYSHDLIGCPEMPIWTATPSIFSSVTVTDNGSSVTVNAGMSGCTITGRAVVQMDHNIFFLQATSQTIPFPHL